MEENPKATFSKIDIESWERKEYFLHYYNDVRCTYSVTVNADITEIYNCVKDNGLRLYPTLIWWIANAVNHFQFLRFNHDDDGNIGYYNEVNPSFTFMPQGSEKFHVLWCKYDRSSRRSWVRACFTTLPSRFACHLPLHRGGVFVHIYFNVTAPWLFMIIQTNWHLFISTSHLLHPQGFADSQKTVLRGSRHKWSDELASRTVALLCHSL